MKNLFRIAGAPVFATMVLASSAVIAQTGNQPPAGQPQDPQAAQSQPHTQQHQTQSPQSVQQQSNSQEVALDEELKEKFVTAYSEIIDIQINYMQRLESVTDEAEASRLQQQAQAEMHSAVTEAEMTVEEYNQVIQMASVNDALREELEAAVAQARSS